MLPQYDDPVADEVCLNIFLSCLYVCTLCSRMYAFIYVLKLNFFICFSLQGLTLDSSGRFSGDAERKLEEVIYLFSEYDDWFKLYN